MEESILKSTKKMLGIEDSYAAFDHEIITNINSVFSTLNQIGIGTGEPIDDDTAEWSTVFDLPAVRLNMVKTYVFLKVKMVFDPPTTSYLIDAMKEQMKEQEARLSIFVESDRILPESNDEEVEV